MLGVAPVKGHRPSLFAQVPAGYQAPGPLAVTCTKARTIFRFLRKETETARELPETLRLGRFEARPVVISTKMAPKDARRVRAESIGSAVFSRNEEPMLVEAKDISNKGRQLESTRIPRAESTSGEEPAVPLLNLCKTPSPVSSNEASPNTFNSTAGSPTKTQQLGDFSERWYNRRSKFMLNKYYVNNYTISAKVEQTKDRSKLTVTDLWTSAGHTPLLTPKCTKRKISDPYRNVPCGVFSPRSGSMTSLGKETEWAAVETGVKSRKSSGVLELERTLRRQVGLPLIYKLGKVQKDKKYIKRESNL